MKRMSGLAALMGAAFLVSACGGDGDGGAAQEGASDDTAAGAGDDASSTEAPVRDESADLVIWSDNVRAPVLREYADEFGEEFGINAQVQVTTDTRQQFKDATNVGQGPDIVVGAHDWLGELVQDGTVDPIQMSSEVESTFTPESIEATKFNGQIYGVPYSTENLSLIRNVDMAPEVPATMEELISTGTDLVDSGEAEAPMVTPVGQPGDAYHAFPYLAAYGGGIFDTLPEGGFDPTAVILDSPETVKGAEKIAMMGEEGALNVSVDGTTAESLFTQGKSPFFVTGPWSLSGIREAGVNYKISPIPDFEDGGKPVPFIGVQMFYVSADAANPTLAQEFVNSYVPTADFQMAMFEAGGRPPALQETLDAVSADDKDIAALAKAGEGAQPMPNIPAMNAVWGPLGVAEVDIIEGADPAKRLGTAEQEITSNIE